MFKHGICGCTIDFGFKVMAKGFHPKRWNPFLNRFQVQRTGYGPDKKFCPS